MSLGMAYFCSPGNELVKFFKLHTSFCLGIVLTAEFPIWHPGNALLYGKPDPENILKVSYYNFGLKSRRGT